MRWLRWGISIEAKIGKGMYELSYQTGISRVVRELRVLMGCIGMDISSGMREN